MFGNLVSSLKRVQSWHQPQSEDFAPPQALTEERTSFVSRLPLLPELCSTFPVHAPLQIDIAVPRVMSLTAYSSFEVRTPKQFKVRFQKVGLDTYVQTPQLNAYLEVPETVSVLGQPLDLSPLQNFIVRPVNAGIETAQGLVNRIISPELPVAAMDMTSMWMLTTYLDDTMRISRDDSGKLFVLLKEMA